MRILVETKDGKVKIFRPKSVDLVLKDLNDPEVLPFYGSDIQAAEASDNEIITTLTNCLLALNELPNKVIEDLNGKTRQRLALEVDQLLRKLRKRW